MRRRQGSFERGWRGAVGRLGVLLCIAAILSPTAILIGHQPAYAASLAAATQPLPAFDHPASHIHPQHHAVAAHDLDAIPPDHHPGGGPGAPLPHCPVCIALHLLGAFVPPQPVALEAILTAEDAPSASAPAPLVARRFFANAQPRAPPLAA